LIIANDGMLYGTTELGGANTNGVAFRLNRNGSGYTVLWHFGAQGLSLPDGKDPQAGLVQGSDGGFYGSTFGTVANFGNGSGTIFSLGTAPPNDNFANRILLVGPDAVASGFNLNATIETNEPAHTNLVMIETNQVVETVLDFGTNSIWWSWSGLPNGLVSIVDEANTVDAIIDVYTNGTPAGLLNWWRGEGDGKDSAGLNNAGLSNGVAFASGMIGQAFSFDGIYDL
jgi:uncharacterized repeat protein (TIGR03803 family)